MILSCNLISKVPTTDYHKNAAGKTNASGIGHNSKTTSAFRMYSQTDKGRQVVNYSEQGERNKKEVENFVKVDVARHQRRLCFSSCVWLVTFPWTLSSLAWWLGATEQRNGGEKLNLFNHRDQVKVTKPINWIVQGSLPFPARGSTVG